jgi:hypothetical protein
MVHHVGRVSTLVAAVYGGEIIIIEVVSHANELDTRAQGFVQFRYVSISMSSLIRC